MAKHVYTLVDLIGTPAPRVTVEDLVVRKAEEATFLEDPRHRHAPMLVNGPWLDYGHVVGVCIRGLCPHVQTILVRAVTGNFHHTPHAGCGVGLSGERVGWFVHASCCRFFVLVGRESRARYVMNLSGHELCCGGRCRSAVATTFPCQTFCLLQVLKAVAGGAHSMAITGPLPADVAPTAPPSTLAAPREHAPSLALCSRRLWAWGANAYGQLGVGTTGNRVGPAQVPFPHTAEGHVVAPMDVALGSYHSVMLTGGWMALYPPHLCHSFPFFPQP